MQLTVRAGTSPRRRRRLRTDPAVAAVVEAVGARGAAPRRPQTTLSPVAHSKMAWVSGMASWPPDRTMRPDRRPVPRRRRRCSARMQSRSDSSGCGWPPWTAGPRPSTGGRCRGGRWPPRAPTLTGPTTTKQQLQQGQDPPRSMTRVRPTVGGEPARDGQDERDDGEAGPERAEPVSRYVQLEGSVDGGGAKNEGDGLDEHSGGKERRRKTRRGEGPPLLGARRFTSDGA